MARKHDATAVGGAYGGQKIGLCALGVWDQRRLDVCLAKQMLDLMHQRHIRVSADRIESDQFFQNVFFIHLCRP